MGAVPPIFIYLFIFKDWWLCLIEYLLVSPSELPPDSRPSLLTPGGPTLPNTYMLGDLDRIRDRLSCVALGKSPFFSLTYQTNAELFLHMSKSWSIWA